MKYLIDYISTIISALSLLAVIVYFSYEVVDFDFGFKITTQQIEQLNQKLNK